MSVRPHHRRQRLLTSSCPSCRCQGSSAARAPRAPRPPWGPGPGEALELALSTVQAGRALLLQPRSAAPAGLSSISGSAPQRLPHAAGWLLAPHTTGTCWGAAAPVQSSHQAGTLSGCGCAGGPASWARPVLALAAPAASSRPGCLLQEPHTSVSAGTAFIKAK